VNFLKPCLQTNQTRCYDAVGREISCERSGQDAEFRRGIPWPSRRFEVERETVSDRLTGLEWTKDGNIAEFPMTWLDSLNYVAEMNRRAAFGHSDWRLPNRRELRSLMDYQTARPSLTEDHPFRNVFRGWYWTSTTAVINPAYAWYVHMEGARMFYGGKEQFYLVWPVRGEGNGVLPATGQRRCYDRVGETVPCRGTGQDGEFRIGRTWPEPRFDVFTDAVVDNLTGLCWLRRCDLTLGPVAWNDALEVIAEHRDRSPTDLNWRLPNVNELESLVDCSMHSPALPDGHPFIDVRDTYWSSTTSVFETDWAWALYLNKGALGVGHKQAAHFYVWMVCDAEDSDALRTFRLR
jgi:hypothetical protein